jgi:hypothetical protein
MVERTNPSKERNPFENLFAHTTKYHNNDLVRDLKEPIRKQKDRPNVLFEKGILREGTVLRYKGFVVTHKGTKVDTALLNPDNLKDRF